MNIRFQILAEEVTCPRFFILCAFKLTDNNIIETKENEYEYEYEETTTITSDDVVADVCMGR